MADNDTVQTEDLIPVRSRISWGAIFAGSVLALALYLLLTLLGGAIGLSVGDRFDARNIGVGAAVYAILVTAACLFVGGYVASQLTTGENRTEAAMYGLMVWAVVFGMILWLMATGVRAGFGAMMGAATATDMTARADGGWEAAARQAGVPQARIDEWRASASNAAADARAAVNAPANRAAAGETATRAAWYTFLGTLVSMLAAVFGGLAGAGASLRLFAVSTTTARRISPQPTI
jgi:hypothetical protein